MVSIPRYQRRTNVELRGMRMDPAWRAPGMGQSMREASNVLSGLSSIASNVQTLGDELEVRRAERTTGGALGEASTTGLAIGGVAADSAVAESLAKGESGHLTARAAAEAVDGAYDPLIAGAANPTLRAGFEIQRDTLKAAWTKAAEQLEGVREAARRAAVSAHALDTARTLIGIAQTPELVESLTERSLLFNDRLIREDGQDPATLDDRRRARAEEIHRLAELRKAELDPRGYLARSGEAPASSLVTTETRDAATLVASRAVEDGDRRTDSDVLARAAAGTLDERGLDAAIARGEVDGDRLAVGEARKLIQQQQAEAARYRADETLMAKVRARRMNLDLGRRDHRRALQSDFAQAAAREDPKDWADWTFRYINSVGAVPPQVTDGLETLLRSSDPAKLAQGGSLFVKLEAMNPTYVAGLSDTARDRGGYLDHRRVELGDFKAAARALATRDRLGPELVARRNAAFDRDKRFAPHMAESVLRQSMQDDVDVGDHAGWTGKIRLMALGDVHGAFKAPPLMMADYDRAARVAYREHGDLRRAYGEAYQQVRRRWRPSYINGAPEFMRDPPEVNFRIGSEPPTETVKWQRAQAAWRFNIADARSVRFSQLPGRNTVAGKPVYAIFIASKDGWIRAKDPKTGAPSEWAPDVAGEKWWRGVQQKKKRDERIAADDKRARAAMPTPLGR